MKRKFKIKKKIKTNRLLFIILILYILVSVIYNGKIINIKDILLRSSLNSIIDEKSYFLDLVDINITTPKNIIYSSLNRVVKKEDLSVFKEYDDFDSYEENNSVYVEDISESNVLDPLVYIYNTHQLEEYNSNIFNSYNIVPNVMIASYTLKEKLMNKKINAIVETNNIKDYLNNNGLNYYHSYRASKYFTLEAMKNNPSLNYFIDLHRDSAPLEVTQLIKNDIPYARILFVVGMDNEHAEENLRFANDLNNKMEIKLEGISRGVMKKGDGSGEYVFNQDIHPNMILLEMGGVDNSIEEVYNTLEIIAEVLKEIIEEGTYG